MVSTLCFIGNSKKLQKGFGCIDIVYQDFKDNMAFFRVFALTIRHILGFFGMFCLNGTLYLEVLFFELAGKSQS